MMNDMRMPVKTTFDTLVFRKVCQVHPASDVGCECWIGAASSGYTSSIVNGRVQCERLQFHLTRVQ